MNDKTDQVSLEYTESGARLLMMQTDPRTVAREIPGLFDAIFPQLTPGVVAHFNRTAGRSSVESLSSELIGQSKIQRSMLFELAFAVGESLLDGGGVDCTCCLEVAVRRQRQHFDAQIPDVVAPVDREIAELVGKNLAKMIFAIAAERNAKAVRSPVVPGFEWIASGVGDFSAGGAIVEVKCSARHFSASDYRQVAIYWLLSFAQSLERGEGEWTEGLLVNPRLATSVVFDFDEFIHIVSSGRTKIEILEIFSAMVGVRRGR